MVATGLGVGLAKIVEYWDGDLIVVASYGFDLEPEDIVLGPAGETSAGHALDTGTPTVSGDVVADRRFRRATIEQGDQVCSVLNVPIPNLTDPDVDWYGVIETDSEHADAFNEDQIAFLKLYANLVAAAISRRETHRRLEALVADKHRLLEELQHRTKNNLAIITAFVRLQSRNATSDETIQQLSAIEQRVATLRLLHDQLYSHHSSTHVELDTYLAKLTANMVEFYRGNSSKIEFRTHFPPYVASIDQAITIGLIINESVTNSMKHAFTQSGGVIDVMFRADGHDAELTLRDDAVGLSASNERIGGTGMALVDGLASNLARQSTGEMTRGPGCQSASS